MTTVLVVTPYADQVLHLASGVCTVGSIKLSHYIKHEEAGRYKNIEVAYMCWTGFAIIRLIIVDK